jgi:hypothetical protein
MVISFPRLFVASAKFGPRPDQTTGAEGFVDRMLDYGRRAFCGLHGHDLFLQFQQKRMFLRCVSCGHESPGWELNQAPPTVAQDDERRLEKVPAHLIGERRIAC